MTFTPEYLQAYHNDATVHRMHRDGHTAEEVIVQLAKEKADLFKRIAELELIAPRKIRKPDGTVLVYRAPHHLVPEQP